jgi:hypothetical protein
MARNVVMNLWVDDRLEAYKDFLTTAAATEVYNHVSNAPKLLKIVDYLVANWRATAYAAAMPAQFAQVGKVTLEGFMGGDVGDTALLDLAKGMLNKLTEKVPELVDDPALSRKLFHAAVTLGAEFREWREGTKLDFPAEKTWRELLDSHDFGFYVWWTERSCFQAAYNAYEDFLVQCVCRANNDPPKCWTTSGRWEGWVVGKLGQDIWDACWQAAPVERLRLMRHSLAHASGRVTELMKSKKISAREVDGVMQFGPDDVRDAISVLQPCVLRILHKATAMPCFN